MTFWGLTGAARAAKLVFIKKDLTFLVCFRSNFPLNFDEKIDTKSDAEQGIEIVKNPCENALENDAKLKSFRNVVSQQIEFSGKGGCKKTI